MLLQINCTDIPLL